MARSGNGRRPRWDSWAMITCTSASTPQLLVRDAPLLQEQPRHGQGPSNKQRYRAPPPRAGPAAGVVGSALLVLPSRPKAAARPLPPRPPSLYPQSITGRILSLALDNTQPQKLSGSSSSLRAELDSQAAAQAQDEQASEPVPQWRPAAPAPAPATTRSDLTARKPTAERRGPANMPSTAHLPRHRRAPAGAQHDSARAARIADELVHLTHDLKYMELGTHMRWQSNVAPSHSHPLICPHIR